jgi:hypothetical protein
VRVGKLEERLKSDGKNENRITSERWLERDRPRLDY